MCFPYTFGTALYDAFSFQLTSRNKCQTMYSCQTVTSIYLQISRIFFWGGGPPILVSNGYQGPSLGVKQQDVKMTTHLHLVLRSRICGAIPPLPQYAFMVCCSVKNTAWTMSDGVEEVAVVYLFV